MSHTPDPDGWEFFDLDWEIPTPVMYGRLGDARRFIWCPLSGRAAIEDPRLGWILGEGGTCDEHGFEIKIEKVVDNVDMVGAWLQGVDFPQPTPGGLN